MVGMAKMDNNTKKCTKCHEVKRIDMDKALKTLITLGKIYALYRKYKAGKLPWREVIVLLDGLNKAVGQKTHKAGVQVSLPKRKDL